MIPNNGTLVDISGNGNNGTLQSVTQSIDGLVFDGLSPIPCDIPTLTMNIATYLMRFNCRDFTNTPHLFGGISTTNGYVKLTPSAPGAKIIIEAAGGGDTFTFDYIFLANQTYNIAITVDASFNWTLWVNGVEEQTGSLSTNLFYFRRIGCVGSTRLFDGLIEEVLVYNTVVADQNIIDYHNSFAKRITLIEDFSLDRRDGS
jgi:hypothetical protein